MTLATDVTSARHAVRTQLFAAAVVDRRLPDGEGTEFVTELRRTGNPLPVLMLTALGEIRDRVTGLDAGANDYLVKPFDFAELEARLRALTRDFTRPDTGIEIGGWTFFPTTHTVQSPYAGRVQLTETESALLHIFATHPETAFSRQQLRSAVFERGDLEGSVDTYVHYLRRKTERGLIDTVREWATAWAPPHSRCCDSAEHTTLQSRVQRVVCSPAQNKPKVCAQCRRSTPV